MKVEIRPEAYNDLVSNSLHYEAKDEGLGDHFISSLMADLRKLKHEAGIHAKAFGLHRKLAARFPYAIYYQVEEAVVEVIAVIDLRRDPRYIERTLKRRG